MPEHEAGTHRLLDGEEVELPAQNAVIPLARLVQPVKVDAQVLLLEKGRAVDALEHLPALVAAPVGPRHVEQLVVPQSPGRGQVRPPAEVQERAVAVDGDHLARAHLLQALQLEGVVGEELARLLAGHHRALEGVVGLDDRRHARLDGLDLLRGERLGHVEVVVEAVVDGGAEAYAGRGNDLAHRGCEHVRRGVAQHAQRLGVALGEQSDLGAVGEGPAQVDDLAVDDRRQGGARQPRADLGGEVGGGGSGGEREGASVGEADADGVGGGLAFHAGKDNPARRAGVSRGVGGNRGGGGRASDLAGASRT